MPSYWKATPSPWKDQRVLITGGNGFLGQRLSALLRHEGAQVITPSHAELNLSISSTIEHHLYKYRPGWGKAAFDVIFHLAAKVGGIGDVSANPYTYISRNLSMATNLLDSVIYVEDFSTRVILASSVCAYPLNAPQPLQEKNIWDGEPEPTNGPYGVAKRVLLSLANAARAQYRLPCGVAVLANMYGPGDHYDLHTSHAIPSIILKMHQAKLKGNTHLSLWGSGNPTRDFLFVDDAAEALARMGLIVDDPDPINIGSGRETSIRQAATTIAKYLQWDGEILWDTSRPDGQPRRLLDVSLARTILEWEATTLFESGIELTISDYMHNLGAYVERVP